MIKIVINRLISLVNFHNHFDTAFVAFIAENINKQIVILTQFI